VRIPNIRKFQSSYKLKVKNSFTEISKKRHCISPSLNQAQVMIGRKSPTDSFSIDKERRLE
jgi:hypothetical protein